MKPSSLENRVDGFTTGTVACLFCNSVSATDTDQFHCRHRQFHWRYRVLNFGERRGRLTKPMSAACSHSVVDMARELFARSSRLDDAGLIWLDQGHYEIAVTETVAHCQRGANLMYRKQDKPAAGQLGLDDMGLTI